MRLARSSKTLPATCRGLCAVRSPATSRRLSAGPYFTITPYRVGGIFQAGLTGPVDSGPGKFKLELHHPALRRPGSDVDVYAAKLAALESGARVLVMGSSQFGAGEMSTQDWANIHTDANATVSWGTELGTRRGTVVSRNRSTGTWSVKLDGGEFTDGRLLEQVPTSRLRAGVRMRVLINPGTSVDTMESHVHIMWPEPVAEGGVAMEISGAPIPPAENMIWMLQMAEGRFAVRINGGPPIPCKSNREMIGIKVDYRLKLLLVIGFVPISGLSYAVIGSLCELYL